MYENPTPVLTCWKADRLLRVEWDPAELRVAFLDAKTGEEVLSTGAATLAAAREITMQMIRGTDLRDALQ